jgi:predicted unusual protein kinase regulating ubiquinone biosynthesis (AarF/ABC1/UbiB family)
MSEDGLDGIARGLGRRTLATARLAGKLGLGYLRRGRGGDDREAAVRVATEIVEQVGSLKGMAVKVGQIVSYMPGAFPPEAQEVLARLQTRASPMRYSVIEAALRRELGRAPDEVFDQLDRDPVAAASVGQVHRAVYQGRPVAVKIQYPDIEPAMDADLKLAGLMARLMVVGSPNDPVALAGELRARMLEECDYGLEARRQTLFRELYAARGGRVPEVVDAISTRRVLCTEWVEGLGFDAFARSAPAEVRSRAGETIFACVFETLFEHAIYNGDPHPGNYVFDPDGRVTFLDFGCVREFSLDFIESWKPLERAMLAEDRAAVRAAFPATGMMGVPEDRFDWDHHYGIMEYVCRPYLAPQPFTYTQDYVEESYGRILFDKKAMAMLSTPPEWLLLNRVHWGLNSVLGRLEATADWRAHWTRAVSRPTTPIRCP